MVYVDTSVAVASVVPEAKTAAIDTRFSANNDPLVAADWVTAEFASALSIKERRGDLTPEAAAAVWQEFTGICGTGLRLVPVSRSAFADAARLARAACGPAMLCIWRSRSRSRQWLSPPWTPCSPAPPRSRGCEPSSFEAWRAFHGTAAR